MHGEPEVGKLVGKSAAGGHSVSLDIAASHHNRAPGAPLHQRRNIFRETFPILSNGENEDADFVFAQQGKFIVELAEKGNCVIAGRRADYYLRDNPKAFHLFFYADTDFKVERICRMENCTEEEALKKIKDMDKRRKTSYEYVTGRKWADRHNYDRMICTSSLGLDKCVDEIVNLLSEKS